VANKLQINPIDLRVVDQRCANIYEAIIVASNRARQINSENKINYNAQLSTIPTTGNDDDSEDIQNPLQMKIALEFEKNPKPHVAAINELLEGKVEYFYKTKN
jgi:DNA-directed RNA polymerase subunit K/omega